MKRTFTLLFLALCLSTAVPGQTAYAQDWDESGSVIRDFENAASGWRSGLTSEARKLAITLATIEVVFCILVWLLKSQGQAEITWRLLFKFAFIGLIGSMIMSFDFWFPPLISGFMSTGAMATGSNVLQPGEVFYHGYKLHTMILEEYEFSLWGFDGGMIGILIGAYGILFAYLYISVTLALALIYSIVLLSVGPFLLCFAVWKPTAGIAEAYVKKTFEIAVKLFMIQIVVALGTSLSLGWLAKLNQAGPLELTPVAQVGIGVAIFTAVVATIPSDLSSTVASELKIPFTAALRG